MVGCEPCTLCQNRALRPFDEPEEDERRRLVQVPAELRAGAAGPRSGQWAAMARWSSSLIAEKSRGDATASIRLAIIGCSGVKPGSAVSSLRLFG